MNCNEGKMVISYCFVCKDYLCSTCERAQRRLRVTRDHRNVLLEKGHLEHLLERLVMCEQEGDEGEDLLYYCEKCNECICDICHDDRHWRHDVVDIKQAAREGKKRLDKILKKAEDEITANEDAIKKSEDIFNSRKKKLRAARKNMKGTVRYFMRHTKGPYSVSVALDGRVIVCDSDDALVKVLSPNGEALLQSLGDPYEYGSPSFAIHH